MVAALFAVPWQAAPAQRPATFAYNCDQTGVMQDMAWTSWGPEGVHYSGLRPTCS